MNKIILGILLSLTFLGVANAGSLVKHCEYQMMIVSNPPNSIDKLIAEARPKAVSHHNVVNLMGKPNPAFEVYHFQFANDNEGNVAEGVIRTKFLKPGLPIVYGCTEVDPDVDDGDYAALSEDDGSHMVWIPTSPKHDSTNGHVRLLKPIADFSGGVHLGSQGNGITVIPGGGPTPDFNNARPMPLPALAAKTLMFFPNEGRSPTDIYNGILIVPNDASVLVDLTESLSAGYIWSIQNKRGLAIKDNDQTKLCSPEPCVGGNDVRHFIFPQLEPGTYDFVFQFTGPGELARPVETRRITASFKLQIVVLGPPGTRVENYLPFNLHLSYSAREVVVQKLAHTLFLVKFKPESVISKDVYAITHGAAVVPKALQAFDTQYGRSLKPLGMNADQVINYEFKDPDSLASAMVNLLRVRPDVASIEVVKIY